MRGEPINVTLLLNGPQRAGEKQMSEKYKPQADIVHKAASFMTHPEKATPEDIKRMAPRILDDQRNDPQKNAATSKKI